MELGACSDGDGAMRLRGLVEALREALGTSLSPAQGRIDVTQTGRPGVKAFGQPKQVKKTKVKAGAEREA